MLKLFFTIDLAMILKLLVCIHYLYLQGITLKSIMTVDVLFKLEVVAETVEFKVSLKSTVAYSVLRRISLYCILLDQ